jgi:hypothetical protein
MPGTCTTTDGRKFPVTNKVACQRYGEGSKFEPDPTGCPSFVRHVFARVLGSAIVDLGSFEAVTRGVIECLTIRKREGPSLSRKRSLTVVKLTPARRRALAWRAAASILTLARTYQTLRDFRDRVLLTTPRGRDFKTLYERHVADIYDVAKDDLLLMHAAAMTWLAGHPFAVAMIAASDRRPARRGRRVVLTARMHQRCVNLVRGFRNAATDVRFRRALREVETELRGYRGLDPAQAMERLRRP